MKKFFSFIDRCLGGTPASGTPPPPPTGQAIAPNPPPIAAPKIKGGHIDRQRMQFRHIQPNEVFSDQEESHYSRNGVMASETVKIRIITASGKVVDSAAVESICSVCGLPEDEVIRCSQSHVTLCHACKETFEQPDGTEVIVSPDQLSKLKSRYNLWDEYDAKRRGFRK